jgi:hypothetical protein
MSYFTYLANRDADPDQARRLAEAALAPAVPNFVPITVHMTIPRSELHRWKESLADDVRAHLTELHPDDGGVVVPTIEYVLVDGNDA